MGLAPACFCASAAQVDENTFMGRTLGTAILNANRKLRGLHVKSDYEALSFLAGMGGEQEGFRDRLAHPAPKYDVLSFLPVLRNAAVERIAQQANSASAPQ